MLEPETTWAVSQSLVPILGALRLELWQGHSRQQDLQPSVIMEATLLPHGRAVRPLKGVR